MYDVDLGKTAFLRVGLLACTPSSQGHAHRVPIRLLFPIHLAQSKLKLRTSRTAATQTRFQAIDGMLHNLRLQLQSTALLTPAQKDMYSEENEMSTAVRSFLSLIASVQDQTLALSASFLG